MRTPQEKADDARRKRERRLRFKAAGMCSTCGHVPPVEGMAECERCRESSAERSLRSYHENDGAKKMRERCARYKAEGRCTHCGSELVADAVRPFEKRTLKLSKCETCIQYDRNKRPAA